jgi:hypothetical protein
MFQPLLDEPSTLHWQALQSRWPANRSVYHRLLGHVIFTMPRATLAVAETWYQAIPAS